MGTFFQKQPLTSAERTNRFFTVVLFSLIVIISFLFDPAQIGLPACKFKDISGLPCPTCGISRSFDALTQFKFAQSFDFHVMGPLLFLMLMFIIVKFAVELHQNHKIILNTKLQMGRYFLALIFAFWLINWIYNILIIT